MINLFQIKLIGMIFLLLPSVQAAQQDVTFNIWELRVKGNTLLDNKQVEMAVYPYLGPKKTVDAVEQARATLESIYHHQGYKTVSVFTPEQDALNGIIYLQVVEGKIDRLRVKDSRYFSLHKIKQAVPALAEGNVPNMKKMQEQLQTLSRQTADRKIYPIMRAGKTPGTTEVDLKVRDELPLHGSVELNGRNSADTTRLRLVTSISYDNFWQAYHSGSFLFQTSPEDPDEVEVFSGTYVMPVIDEATRLALYAVHSGSSSQIAQAGDSTVIGAGEIYGVRLIRALEGSHHYFHSIMLGVDYKDFEEDTLLGGVNARSAPITYLPFMAQYRGNYRAGDLTARFNFGINFSFRGIANDDADFANKREGARANYMIASLGGEVRYQLPWEMEFVSRLSAQYADSPLINNEQFSIGGTSTVRGYFESQELVDDAIVANVELYSPRLAPLDWEAVDKLRALMFVDVAQGWVKRAAAGRASSVNVYSIGIGLRTKLLDYFVGALDWAFPLVANDEVSSGESRVHFNVGLEF